MEYSTNISIEILIIFFLWCAKSSISDDSQVHLCVDYLAGDQCGKFFKDYLISNISHTTKEKAEDFCTEYSLQLISEVKIDYFTLEKQEISFWTNKGEVRYDKYKTEVQVQSSSSDVFAVCDARKCKFKDHEICAKKMFCANDRCFDFSNDNMDREAATQFCKISQLAEIKDQKVYQEMKKLIRSNDVSFWLRPTRSSAVEWFKWSDDDTVTGVLNKESNCTNLRLNFRDGSHTLDAVCDTIEARALCQRGTCAYYLDADQCGKYFSNNFIANELYESKDKAEDLCRRYGLELTSDVRTAELTFKELFTAFWTKGGVVKYNDKGVYTPSKDVSAFPVCFANETNCLYVFKDPNICTTNRKKFCANKRCFYFSPKKMSRQEAAQFCKISQLAEIKDENIFQEIGKLMRHSADYWLRPARYGKERFIWSDEDNVTNVIYENLNDHQYLYLSIITNEYPLNASGSFKASGNTGKAFALCEGGFCADYLADDQCGNFFNYNFIARTSYESKDKAADFCRAFGLELIGEVNTNHLTFRKQVTAFWTRDGEVRFNQNKEKIIDLSEDVPIFPVCGYEDSSFIKKNGERIIIGIAVFAVAEVLINIATVLLCLRVKTKRSLSLEQVNSKKDQRNSKNVSEKVVRDYVTREKIVQINSAGKQQIFNAPIPSNCLDDDLYQDVDETTGFNSYPYPHFMGNEQGGYYTAPVN